MVVRHSTPGRTRALLGAVVSVVLLLAFLARLEGPEGGVACSPLAPASAAAIAPASIEPEPQVELAPVPHVPAPSPPSEPVATRPAVPTTASSVSGSVIDALTGDVVPWVDVELSLGSVHTIARTGLAGTFVSSAVFASGNLKARVIDGQEEVGDAVIPYDPAHPVSDWQIPVPIGPTVPIDSIDLQPVMSVSGWHARIVEGQFPVGSAGEIDVARNALKLAGSKDAREWSWRPVRNESGHVFVRWPRVMEAPDPALFPRLQIANENLYRRGRVVLEGTIGVLRPVSLLTKGYAVVTGRVTVRGGLRPANVHVLLVESVDRDREEFDHMPAFAETIAPEGEFKFETNGTGTLILAAWALGVESDPSLCLAAAFTTVLVHDGLVYAPDMEMYPDGRGANTLLEMPAKSKLTRRNSQVARMRIAFLGRFSEAWTFDYLPERGIETSRLPFCPFDVENIGIDEEPLLPRVYENQILPNPSLDESHGHDGERGIYRIEAFDAGGVTELKSVDVTAGPAGSLFTTREASSDKRWQLWSSTPFSFQVWGRDSIPVQVTESAFGALGAERVARVRLQPGWGALIAFRAGDPDELAKKGGAKLSKSRLLTRAYGDAFSMPPLASVKVRAGDTTLGVSDAEGCVLLGRTIMPRRLSIEADGWQLCQLQKMPGPGARWFAWMKRDP